ncbi:MAG: hypothetical protein KA198_02635 [Chitinophagaceae bacterium]|nr:hypothetical protein [Chitinophagaceae bacterium]
MPVIINEIIIRSNVETPAITTNSSNPADELNEMKSDLVKQCVEKVLEILNEKKQR